MERTFVPARRALLAACAKRAAAYVAAVRRAFDVRIRSM
ncbi:unnamed protein product [Burkholderia pseudomallei]|nr:unnamed protein product [Burkholderia pseudomallei]